MQRHTYSSALGLNYTLCLGQRKAYKAVRPICLCVSEWLNAKIDAPTILLGVCTQPLGATFCRIASKWVCLTLQWSPVALLHTTVLHTNWQTNRYTLRIDSKHSLTYLPAPCQQYVFRLTLQNQWGIATRKLLQKEWCHTVNHRADTKRKYKANGLNQRAPWLCGLSRVGDKAKRGT